MQVSHASPMIAGVCPVLAVPFDVAGQIDADGLQAIAEHVFDAKASTVMLFGLASEFHKLADDEKDILRDALLELTRNRGDRTAIISITHHSTEVAVAQATAAEAAGADALNVIPPYFLGPPQQAIIDHLAAVLDAVEIPVVVQYAPNQTGTTLSPDTLREISAAHSNLRHIKVETVPPGRYIQQLAQGNPPLAGLVGYAGVQLPDALQRGAVGVQPGCSFVEIYIELWRRHETGDRDGFAALHSSMLPYLAYWMQNVELIIQVEKTILHRRGLIATDYCRHPGWDLDPPELEMIDRFLTEFGGHFTK